MNPAQLAAGAKKIVEILSLDLPSRRVGSPGNRRAAEFIAWQMEGAGFRVECPQFDCLDWVTEGASLKAGGEAFAVLPGPYSPGCHGRAALAVVSNLAELEAVEAGGKILLLQGELVGEQLAPKNFPFYNSEQHQRIIHLLEEKAPLAVAAATTRNPQLTGGVYPFPLIEDGDFDIPSLYMTEVEGARLARLAGQVVELELRARRIPARGSNVLGYKGPPGARRVVLSAHLDAKQGTPGALDNAGGIAVLLVAAQLLESYTGRLGVELVAFNGEDDYSAAGEVQYLQRNQGRLGEIVLNLNIDGAGYRQGLTAFSLYSCPDELAARLRAVLGAAPGLVEGEAWYQSDHMVFVQNGVPAAAFTSSQMADLWARIAHTAQDTPDLVDPARLVGLARCLCDVVATLGEG